MILEYDKKIYVPKSKVVTQTEDVIAPYKVNNILQKKKKFYYSSIKTKFKLQSQFEFVLQLKDRWNNFGWINFI